MNSKYAKLIAGFGAAGALSFIALMIAAFTGWIMNIVKIVGLIGGDISAMFVARIVGVFAAPLGAILGWF